MVKREDIVIYIQIPETHRANGVILLVKSGLSIVCLPQKQYGVREEHLKLLKRRRIPFKKIDNRKIRLPKPSLAL